MTTYDEIYDLEPTDEELNSIVVPSDFELLYMLEDFIEF